MDNLKEESTVQQTGLVIIGQAQFQREGKQEQEDIEMEEARSEHHFA